MSTTVLNVSLLRHNPNVLVFMVFMVFVVAQTSGMFGPVGSFIFGVHQ